MAKLRRYDLKSKSAENKASDFILSLRSLMDIIAHKINGQTFLVTAGRSIFWEEEQILVMSDLHLGKSGHFRKHGIAVPQTIFTEDMHRLVSQLQHFKPRRLLVVGDLFHSEANKELNMFLKWRKDLAHIPIDLVKGNHDILKSDWYAQADISVHLHSWSVKGFSFVHDINDCGETEEYCFSGHIHPRIILNGSGRQSVQVPCFYFGKKYAVIPAFGKFTGTYPVKPTPGDAVYALADNMVIQVY